MPLRSRCFDSSAIIDATAQRPDARGTCAGIKLAWLLWIAILVTGCATPTTNPHQLMPSNMEVSPQPVVDLSLGNVTLGYKPQNAHEGEMLRVALRQSLLKANIFSIAKGNSLNVELKSLAITYPSFATTFRVDSTGSYMVTTSEGKSVFETLVTAAGVSEATEHFVGTERLSRAVRRSAAANIKEFINRLGSYLQANTDHIVALAGGRIETDQTDSPVWADRENLAAPQSTPRPAYKYVERRFVTSRANLRSGPGKEFDVITVLDPGTVVEVAPESNGDWYLVRDANGRTGHVFVNLLLTEDAYAERNSGKAVKSDQTAAAPLGPSLQTHPKPATEDAATHAKKAAAPPAMILISPSWQPGMGDILGVSEIGTISLVGKISGSAKAFAIDGSDIPLKPGGFFSTDLMVSNGQVIKFVISYGFAGEKTIYTLAVKLL